MMNERIKELMKKAGGHMKAGEFRGFFLPPPPDYIDPETVDLKKFSELLIKECIMICDKVENDYLNNEQLPNNEKYAIGAGVCRNTLYKHFGVKE